MEIVMSQEKCRECGTEISAEAESCPQCGSTKTTKKKSLLVLFLFGLVGLAVLGNIIISLAISIAGKT